MHGDGYSQQLVADIMKMWVPTVEIPVRNRLIETQVRLLSRYIMQRASSGATAAFLPRARPARCTPCGSASRSTDDRRVCRHRRTPSPRRRRRPASDNDAGAGRRD
jgi:hypothetical protein